MHHIRVETVKPSKSITLKMENKNKSSKSLSNTEKLQFFSGNPAVEISEGIIHLYKNESKHGEKELTLGSLPVNRTQLVCVLAVPSYMSPSDFATFTAAYLKNIAHMRIIRDNSTTKYMVLIKFTDQDSSDEFYLQFNGKQYNSMEAETCIVFFVSSVEFIKHTPSKKISPPIGLIELPTCPVCLEKLDESVSGVLTILCNHSFHCSCLAKWKGDNSCPVCRYCHEPEGQGPVCSTCFTTESLWICLVCGNIGCGRYVNEHAALHYKETMHAYSLELQTSRVWDYAGDGYVHRLVQNKSDGNLVPMPPPTTINQNEVPHVPDSKLESISLEYSYLLDTQKKYFEEQLRKIERDKLRKVLHLEEEYAQLLEDKVKFEKKLKENDEERKRNQKKVSTLEKQMKEMSEEKTFLQQINEALKVNQNEWQEKIKVAESTRDKKISELEEQIRDLMFFIDAKEKVENSGGDLKDGQVIMVQNGNTNSHQKKTPASPS